MQNAALALGVRASRLCNFSDCLFSIIATITAVPLAANVAEKRRTNVTDEQDVDEQLQNAIFPIFYCFVTFNIISRSQLWHCVMFDKVEKCSILVIFANTLFLMFVSFIPMGYTLLSEASIPSTDDTISGATKTQTMDTMDFQGPSIFFISLMACVRFSGAFLVYLLPLREDPFQLLKRRRSLAKQLVGGLCFALLSPIPIWIMREENVYWGLPGFWIVCFVSLSFSDKVGVLIVKEMYGYSDEEVHSVGVNSSRRYSTSRVDAFTDGCLAISATLIILDISSCSVIPDINEPNYSSNSTVVNDCKDMNDYFYNRRSQLSAYVVSFILICSLLWCRHATVWKHLVQSGPLLHFINTQCCCVIALLPYSIELMMSYDELPDQRRQAVIFWLCNVLLISICILSMGFAAFHKSNTLQRDETQLITKQATKRWAFVSGLMLPFWTSMGIVWCIFDKQNSERAWKMSLGFQIICHPLCQIIVFCVYKSQYAKEEDNFMDCQGSSNVSEFHEPLLSEGSETTRIIGQIEKDILDRIEQGAPPQIPESKKNALKKRRRSMFDVNAHYAKGKNGSNSVVENNAGRYSAPNLAVPPPEVFQILTKQRMDLQMQQTEEDKDPIQTVPIATVVADNSSRKSGRNSANPNKNTNDETTTISIPNNNNANNNNNEDDNNNEDNNDNSQRPNPSPNSRIKLRRQSINALQEWRESRRTSTAEAAASTQSTQNLTATLAPKMASSSQTNKI